MTRKTSIRQAHASLGECWQTRLAGTLPIITLRSAHLRYPWLKRKKIRDRAMHQ